MANSSGKIVIKCTVRPGGALLLSTVSSNILAKPLTSDSSQSFLLQNSRLLLKNLLTSCEIKEFAVYFHILENKIKAFILLRL